MNESNDERTLFSWPTSKGDPIGPVWSYGGKKGMYQAEALRMFAHYLVDRIKELELPVREAMKLASGDGLSTVAYCKMMQKRLDGVTRERDRLENRLEVYADNGERLPESCDGIASRDATIQLMDERIERLEARAVRCEACMGDGTIEYGHPNAPEPDRVETCRECNGTGNAQCPKCVEACEILGRAGIADGDLIDKVGDAIEAVAEAEADAQAANVRADQMAAEWMKLKESPKPPHEREIPHCQTCACPPYDAEAIAAGESAQASNTQLAEFLRAKADFAGPEDAALFGLCALVIEDGSAATQPPASEPSLQQRYDIVCAALSRATNRIIELERVAQPPPCVHPWESVGINGDGHPFCAACVTNLVKHSPWGTLLDGAEQTPVVDGLGHARDPDAMVGQLLQSYFWLKTLKTNTRYARLQDDHDGKREGWLSVTIGEDGDAWVSLDADARFRMPGTGGGRNQYTRAALVILAEAIRRDNAESQKESP